MRDVCKNLLASYQLSHCGLWRCFPMLNVGL